MVNDSRHITNEDKRVDDERSVPFEPVGLLTPPAATSATNSNNEIQVYRTRSKRPKPYHLKANVFYGGIDEYNEKLQDDVCRSKSRTTATAKEMKNIHIPITPDLLAPKKPSWRKRKVGVSAETSALSKRKKVLAKNSSKSCRRLLSFNLENDSSPLINDMNNRIGCLYNSLDVYKSVFCNKRDRYVISISQYFPVVRKRQRSKRIARTSFTVSFGNQRVTTHPWNSESTREGGCQLYAASRRKGAPINSTDVPQIMLLQQTPKPRKARQIRARVVKEKIQQSGKSTPMKKHTQKLEQPRQPCHGVGSLVEPHEKPSKGKRRKEMKSKEKTETKRKVKNPNLALVIANNENLQVYHDDVILHDLVQRIEALSIDEHSSLKSAIIPYEQNEGKKIIPKVDLDPETIRMWNRLMIKGKSTEEEEDEMEKKKYWENERKIYRGRVQSFIARMHVIQGDRSFSPWKGSVMDSVIGVFLTQNTSDHLSSSAYMSLLSEFPVKKDHEGEGSCTVDTSLSSQAADSQVDVRQGNSDPKSKSQSKMDRVEEDEADWDKIRDLYCSFYGPRHIDHRDSADWEAVRCAHVDKVASTIAVRGQHNVIAKRIQGFLNKLKTRHKSLDLEWLRNAPGDIVKDYLQRVYGLGLKSVECVRLLALQQKAFPVDVNVARIAVRLGWVPLKLPENFQLHLLDTYPNTDSIQKYLWPRLCELDEETLYELHYQMITWGKSFCVKAQPNCKECPLKGECKYFASKAASERQALPSTAETGVVIHEAPRASEQGNMTYLPLEAGPSTGYTPNHCEPIIEMPASPRPKNEEEEKPLELLDIEDSFEDDSGEILSIKLSAELKSKWWDDEKMGYEETCQSTALVALAPEAASRPPKKLKNAKRLRTEREVYELPDDHPLLKDFQPREPNDPCPYLLAMWTEDEVSGPNEGINMEPDAIRKDLSSTIPGTILIPCRTAMKARFPLNGTYFQVNEVFADHGSSVSPLRVPRALIWNCLTRTVYFGTSTTTVLRGLTLEDIGRCFWRGNVCVRGFDRQTLKPKTLHTRLHRPIATRVGKKETNAGRNVGLENEE